MDDDSITNILGFLRKSMRLGNSQLGAVAATCKLAAKAMGPMGQEGASPTSYISAREAILRNSLIPPQSET